MKYTQKNLIKQFLGSLNGQWLHAYELRGRDTQFGFLGHAADRRCRELAKAGEIEHRIANGFAEYRVAPKNRVEVVHYPGRVVYTEYLPAKKVESKQEALL